MLVTKVGMIKVTSESGAEFNVVSTEKSYRLEGWGLYRGGDKLNLGG